MEPQSRRRTELILILGAFSAVAPLSIDMYLPALPELGRVFAASAAGVQVTLATFFLGYAFGQAFFGPITDRFGRKPPLYVGMTLYALASLGCAFAPSVEMLAVLRFVQALGACATGVVSRAMVRGLFPPAETARVFAALMLVMGVAPILAPLLGGYLLVWFGWQSIFLFLMAFSLITVVVMHFRIPETHGPEQRSPLLIGSILRVYGGMLVYRNYMGFALTGGLCIAGMFAYIAGSPFVFIELYGVEPQHFGWLFGTNAFGLILASQINGRLLLRHTPERLLRLASASAVISAGLLLAAGLTGFGGLWGIMVPLFAYVSGLGFVLPNSTALAMMRYGRNAGSASALLGTLQFGVAALAATGVGAAQNGTALPMAGAIFAVAAAAFAANRIVTTRPAAPEPAEVG